MVTAVVGTMERWTAPPNLTELIQAVDTLDCRIAAITAGVPSIGT